MDLADTLGSSEGGGAAKGMAVGCDWVLGGRPGRRLGPFDTDLGLGGRAGELDLKVPGGRPRPLLTVESRETKTGWAFGMGLGLGLGGRPRPLCVWVKGMKGR